MPIDLAADSHVFTQDFAEPVRFRVDDEATPREIKANVNRQAVNDASEQPFAGTRPPTLHVMARNDADSGIVPSEVVDDVSEIEVAFPLGATPRWRSVLRILRQNPGCVLLEVML